MLEINKVYNYLCLDGMRLLDDKSIDCIITSPPYWQCRDYNFPEQWGLEKTFNEYLEHLWKFIDEAYRVLKDDGTCWINLGDTYGTHSGNFNNNNLIDNKLSYIGRINNYSKPKGYHKCLLCIPHRFVIGCIDRKWILRNTIIWGKKNGLPESTQDRFCKKYEYIFFMTKNLKYYFDLNNIKDKVLISNNSYKNPGDVSDFWDINIKGNKEKHYASYNSELLKKPIIGGCPIKGLILDPFCGTGVTLTTAYLLNRNFIGFDGKQQYCNIANINIKKVMQINKLF